MLKRDHQAQTWEKLVRSWSRQHQGVSVENWEDDLLSSANGVCGFQNFVDGVKYLSDTGIEARTLGLEGPCEASVLKMLPLLILKPPKS